MRLPRERGAPSNLIQAGTERRARNRRREYRQPGHATLGAELEPQRDLLGPSRLDSIRSRSSGGCHFRAGQGPVKSHHSLRERPMGPVHACDGAPARDCRRPASLAWRSALATGAAAGSWGTTNDSPGFASTATFPVSATSTTVGALDANFAACASTDGRGRNVSPAPSTTMHTAPAATPSTRRRLGAGVSRPPGHARVALTLTRPPWPVWRCVRTRPLLVLAARVGLPYAGRGVVVDRGRWVASTRRYHARRSLPGRARRQRVPISGLGPKVCSIQSARAADDGCNLCSRAKHSRSICRSRPRW